MLKPATKRLAPILAFLFLLSVAPFTLAPTPTYAQSGSQTFPETGHTVKGKFLTYWRNNGGLPQQGYPISEEIQEVSNTNGKTYTMQYFERAVFEYHPENAGKDSEVLLSLLGVFYYDRKYAGGAPGQRTSTDNPRLFNETGFTVGGVFRRYWETHGGLAQQGYPISEEFQETSDTDGKSYTVQYFERAVFEYHPEYKGTNSEVLLSLLGVFYRDLRQGSSPEPPAGPNPTAVPSGATSQIVTYSKVGSANLTVGTIDSKGEYVLQTSDSIGNAWTHVTAVGNHVIFLYRSDDGSAQTLRINADGSTTVLKEWGANGFLPGWTTVAALPNGVAIFYRNGTSFSISGRFNADGTYNSLTSYNNLSGDWTQIRPLSNNIFLFYSASSGVGASARISASDGTFTQLKRYNFSPNWSWITQGGDRTVLFYKISDGTGATAVVDDNGNLAQLANYPKKDNRYYGGKLDIGAAWSHIVYLSNGNQLFYNQTDGSATVWKLLTDGNYDSVNGQLNTIGSNWMEIVGVY